MFFSSPEIDMQIMIYLLVAVFVCCLVYAFFVKEKIKALVLFSVLANLILLLFILVGTRLFHAYDILWFRTFSFFVWPIINVYLTIKIFSKK